MSHLNGVVNTGVVAKAVLGGFDDVKALRDCFRTELKDQLEELKKKNPRYSLRAMSRAFKISSGTLSEFLNEKRTFSLKKIETILGVTDLELVKTRELIRKIKSAALT